MPRRRSKKLRRQRGGNNWKCTCNRAEALAEPLTPTPPRTEAAIKLQAAARRLAATKKAAPLRRAAATKKEAAAAAAAKKTEASLKSALATQRAAMSADQKGMQALMDKGKTKAEAEAILARQSKKKEIAQKIQSRNVGTSTPEAKKQAKKTVRKVAKAQKKTKNGGKKRKTRRLRRKHR